VAVHADLRVDDGSATDLSGTWAQLVVTTSQSSAPLVGELTTENHRVFLVELAQDGGAIHAESELCGMNVETSTAMASTVVPSAFVAAVGPISWNATLTDGVFASPETHRSLGLSELALGEPLPTEITDPRVTDPDGDGHPGVTIQVTGLAGGQMYFVQRGWRSLLSTMVSGTRIDGVVHWNDERVILDATSRALRNARPSIPTDDPRENYFQMVRVVDATTCPPVVDAGPALFAR
jgi:hypothetical protein